jgi:hypothetical protein
MRRFIYAIAFLRPALRWAALLPGFGGGALGVGLIMRIYLDRRRIRRLKPVSHALESRRLIYAVAPLPLCLRVTGRLMGAGRPTFQRLEG